MNIYHAYHRYWNELLHGGVATLVCRGQCKKKLIQSAYNFVYIVPQGVSSTICRLLNPFYLNSQDHHGVAKGMSPNIFILASEPSFFIWSWNVSTIFIVAAFLSLGEKPGGSIS